MLDYLKQNLSDQSFSNINTSYSLEQGRFEYTSSKKLYNYIPCLENESESSIKNDTDDRASFASSLEKYQITREKIFNNVYCPICNSVCSVLILETGDLTMECKCSRIINIFANEFINDYLHRDNDKDKNTKLNGFSKKLSELSCCKKHPMEKFVFYCTDCCEDRCKKCLEKEEALYSNTEKKNKHCENHTLKRLDQNETIFEDIKDLMDKIEDEIQFSRDDKKIMDNLFLIIRCFLENYNQYQCYNSLLSIQNFKKFLEKVYQSKNSRYEFKKRGKTIHLIKIRTKKELIEKFHQFNLMYSIEITKTYENINLSIFNNFIFSNLNKLILRGNLIEDISFLTKNYFPVLEKIDLEENQIGNDAIEILPKANLPKLKHLNLFKNKITSIKIFGVIKNFKELELFYIGENKFDMEEINRDKSFFIFPDSLEEFGITGNFNGNADFINQLNIENLKTFYISRNQISDLKCLKNIIFIRLDEFWAISNNITDIKEITNIQGKEKIRKINLKQNKISNFQELFEIVHYFPSLKELVLVDNGISQEEADNMAKRIKIEYDMDLNIKVKED